MAGESVGGIKLPSVGEFVTYGASAVVFIKLLKSFAPGIANTAGVMDGQWSKQADGSMMWIPVGKAA